MLPTINTTAKIQKKNTRLTQDNKSITSLQLSVGEKNTKGEYDNFYFEATFWEKSADFVNNYFNEGDFIRIKGDLITTSYTKDGGAKVYKTEVKFPKAFFVQGNDKKPTANEDYNKPAPQNTPPPPAPNPIPEIDVNEDQIPF